MRKCLFWSAGLLLIVCSSAPPACAADAPGVMTLHTRSRGQAPAAGGQTKIAYQTIRWDAKQTAVIICDMWDRHCCKSASGRVAEMAPRVNDFVTEARKRGVLIIHAPSDCMAAYKNHPARRRAQNAPPADLPKFLKRFGVKLESEEGSPWPIDQSDGGCDDVPPCVQATVWRRENDAIKIADEDAISDSGIEIGNLLAQRGIENVMLLGVHTNMCVISRPFGLRNMVRLGKHVLLVRDLTDAMYNPRMPPRVSHVRGTELMVEYIEQHVCPTIVSSDLLGGPAFRFRADRRPHAE